MLTISIKDAAELKKTSIRTIQRYIKQSKIQSAILEGRNVIPITELTEAEQIRYYSKQGMELPKELKKPAPRAKVQRSTDIETYSADQREQITVWTKILRDWDDY